MITKLHNKNLRDFYYGGTIFVIFVLFSLPILGHLSLCIDAHFHISFHRPPSLCSPLDSRFVRYNELPSFSLLNRLITPCNQVLAQQNNRPSTNPRVLDLVYQTADYNTHPLPPPCPWSSLTNTLRSFCVKTKPNPRSHCGSVTKTRKESIHTVVRHSINITKMKVMTWGNGEVYWKDVRSYVAVIKRTIYSYSIYSGSRPLNEQY
jgi:hypothetical protein